MIPLRQRAEAFDQARYHVQVCIKDMFLSIDQGTAHLETEVVKCYRGNDLAIGDVIRFDIRHVSPESEDVLMGGQSVRFEELKPGNLLEVCLGGDEEPYAVVLDLCQSIQAATETPFFEFNAPDRSAEKGSGRWRLFDWLKR